MRGSSDLILYSQLKWSPPPRLLSGRAPMPFTVPEEPSRLCAWQLSLLSPGHVGLSAPMASLHLPKRLTRGVSYCRTDDFKTLLNKVCGQQGYIEGLRVVCFFTSRSCSWNPDFAHMLLNIQLYWRTLQIAEIKCVWSLSLISSMSQKRKFKLSQFNFRGHTSTISNSIGVPPLASYTGTSLSWKFLNA